MRIYGGFAPSRVTGNISIVFEELSIFSLLSNRNEADSPLYFILYYNSVMMETSSARYNLIF